TGRTIARPATDSILPAYDGARTVAKEALVNRETDLGAFDLSSFSFAAQLPRQLADLLDSLCGDGFSKAGESTGWVHRDASTDSGFAFTNQVLGFAFFGDT